MKLKELLNSAEDACVKAPKGGDSDITVNGTPLDVKLDVVEQNGDSWVDMNFKAPALVEDIIKSSKPMPPEFAELVQEKFWELVDDDGKEKNDN